MVFVSDPNDKAGPDTIVHPLSNPDDPKPVPKKPRKSKVDAEFHEPFGRYEEAEVLGRGGAGKVVLAQDGWLRRDLALKRLNSSIPDEKTLQRFLREARVTGQLEHPNIVPVYDVGLDEQGRLFYTMRRIQGQSLSAVLRAPEYSKTPLAERLRVIVKVCDAMAYAHARGVVHRDLKPANIMIGDFGEVLVVDWGIARVFSEDEQPLDEDSDTFPTPHVATSTDELTRADVVLGTPAYMAPEQAKGEKHLVDQRTDVYALGVILYLVLCGERPFQGRGIQLLQSVAKGVFPPPNQVDPSVPRELNAVVLRAMEVDPVRRYATVADLRDDLLRYLDGRELQAVRYSPVARVLKWAGRNRTIVAAGSIASAVAVGALLIGGGTALTTAVTFARTTGLALADSETALAIARVEQGAVQEARQGLDRARARYQAFGADTLKADVLASWVDWAYPPPLIAIDIGDASVHLALASSGSAFGLIDNTGDAFIYDLPTGALLSQSENASTYARIGFIGDRPIAALRVDEGWKFVDLDSDKVLHTVPLPHSPKPYDTVFFGDGVVVVVDTDMGTSVLRSDDWSLAGPPLPEFWASVVSDNGLRLVARDRKDEVRHSEEPDTMYVVDVATGEVVSDLPWWGDVKISPGGDWVALARIDSVELLNAATGEVIWSKPIAFETRLTFADEGRNVLSFDAHEVVWYRADDGEEIARRPAPGATQAGFSSILCARAGYAIVHRDQTATVWATAPYSPPQSLDIGGRGLGVDVSSDGLLAAVSTREGEIVLVEVGGGSILTRIPTNPDGTRHASFSPDGRALLTAGRDGIARYIDLIDGTQERVFDDGRQRAAATAFVSGGTAVVVYGDGAVVEWDLVSGQKIRTFHDQIHDAWDVVLTPDSRYMTVSGRGDGPLLQVWDLSTSQVVYTSDEVRAGYRAAVSGDGRRVAVSHHLGTPFVVDLNAGFEATKLPRAQMVVMSVGLSEDGSRAWAGGYDGSLILYDVDRQELIASIQIHNDALEDLVVLSDGRVVTVGGVGQMAIFDVKRHEKLGQVVADMNGLGPDDPEHLLQVARARALRGDPHGALDTFARAAAGGANPTWVELARVRRATGDIAGARKALVAAEASGEALPGTLEVWAKHLGKGL